MCVESLEGQRADFPQVYCDMAGSQVFYEDRVSSGDGVEDEVSSDGPLIFCGLPGRGNRYLMVPFAWNGSCLLYTSFNFDFFTALFYWNISAFLDNIK